MNNTAFIRVTNGLCALCDRNTESITARLSVGAIHPHDGAPGERMVGIRVGESYALLDTGRAWALIGALEAAIKECQAIAAVMAEGDKASEGRMQPV